MKSLKKENSKMLNIFVTNVQNKLQKNKVFGLLEEILFVLTVLSSCKKKKEKLLKWRISMSKKYKTQSWEAGQLSEKTMENIRKNFQKESLENRLKRVKHNNA